MPNSVIVGKLHRIEGDEIIMDGGVRITLGPGVTVPKVPIGTSLTVVAVSRNGVTYAERVTVTPEGLFASSGPTQRWRDLWGGPSDGEECDVCEEAIARFWGGRARGEECDACGERIRPAQTIIEAISTQTSQGIQFHVGCFHVWDQERDPSGRLDHLRHNNVATVTGCFRRRLLQRFDTEQGDLALCAAVPLMCPTLSAE